jgi:hypothetical protein
MSAPAPPLSEPLAPSNSVRDGRDAYLAENGFTVAAYDAAWVEVSFLGVSIRTPSTRRRRRALKFHDLHHVATGFGTDLVGEMEISAWELRRGLRGLGLYVGAIIAMVAVGGLVFAPRRTLRAWRVSRRASSLFQTEREYETLLAMTVGDLRREIGVPTGGLADRPRRLHARAPGRCP